MHHNHFDPNLKISSFDIAVIKLHTGVDLSKPSNGILKPCPHSEDYVTAFAVGMGLTHMKPDKAPEALRGVRLYKHPSCGGLMSNYYGLKIDEAFKFVTEEEIPGKNLLEAVEVIPEARLCTRTYLVLNLSVWLQWCQQFWCHDLQ